VPLAVEKLPLFRWRPGARVLMVGARDGAAFDDNLERAEGRSFRRSLDPALLAEAQAKAGTDGICAAWSSTLRFPQALGRVIGAQRGALVVAANGHGDRELCDRLLGVADAWLLLVDDRPGPLAAAILAGGRHAEVLAGWRDPARPLPDGLDWGQARAVHLTSLGPIEADAAAAAWTAARAILPAMVPLYDDAHRHDDCACGANLVWRVNSRSRIDQLDPLTGRCRACGREHAFTLR
jgi:hypothetical protein